MQLMCDAIAALGARHGVRIDPIRRNCGIIRYDAFEQLPQLHLRAGALINGKEYLLPLTPDGETFFFHDQRMTPCSLVLMGLDPQSALKLKLSIVAPFRPRDLDFSTMPIMGLRLEIESLQGHFRWGTEPRTPETVELFVEWGGPDLSVGEAGADALDLIFNTRRGGTAVFENRTEGFPQRDRIVALRGARRGPRFTQTVRIDDPARASLDLAWCTHDSAGFQIQGRMHPFLYTRQFADLDAVTQWARSHPVAIFVNAARVDGIVARTNCGKSVQHLMAYSLHAWLINTWLADRDGAEWLNVWEGNCYFMSTLDVEFTQAPFYLAVWPELLKMQLQMWPEYVKSGEIAIGARGLNTLFMSHDVGRSSAADGQAYPHEMEIEETANYVLLLFAYSRRTGDETIITQQAPVLEKLLAFIAACDTTGNGVPDLGVANTIDDASPAVQYGKDQMYLAVKVLGATMAGAAMLERLGRSEASERCRIQAAQIRGIIAEKGWAGDHFVTLLDPRGSGLVNPWTGEKYDVDEVPGWDAAHIYTANTLPLMDMIGVDLGLNARQIAMDLEVATQRCLREYGCVHSDYSNQSGVAATAMQGLAGVSLNPGWISMNMLRDMAAFYRGVDLRNLAERYWNWQVATNTQEPRLFFETFNGNNLCFYPRGVAVWGFFEALAGTAINALEGIDRIRPVFAQVTVPRLFDADWGNGVCRVIST